MHRIVLDTNVLISGIVFGGIPASILDAVFQGRLALFLSEFICKELSAVLGRRKFRFSQEAIESILIELRQIAHIVIPQKKVSIIQEDPSDNHILETALAAHASFIISGDNHLLNLQVFEGIPILSPREFSIKHLSYPVRG